MRVKLPRSEFALPEQLSKALAGNTQGHSFSSATWGIRFPEVDDLATLPTGAEFVGLSGLRVVTIIDLLPITIIDGSRGLHPADVPVASCP